ncbi:uncharacterized protein [Coffea arabica]|uniref:Uncharacterized protein isoform X2 n=1 Tax=Coffea arabica TaxID=13443 RepID=A0ABM4UQ61_COFAR
MCILLIFLYLQIQQQISVGNIFSVSPKYFIIIFSYSYCRSKLTKTMDSSLWDPPICEDDSADFKGNWQSDFSSGVGCDVMEEDAINERCCIEVLKKLIPKADAEIKELEEEIIFLQAQVALEDDAWAKICFDTLTERTKVLDISIQRLKNEKVQQQQGQASSSQTHGDPAQNEKQQTENELNFCFQTDGDPAQNKKQQTEDELDVCFQTDGDAAKIESPQTEKDLDSHIQTCKEPSQNQKIQLEHEMRVLCQTHLEPAQIENLQAEHERDFNFQTNGDPGQDETLQMEHEMGVPHHKHGEPAPKLSEILKALLEKYYFPNRDKQSTDETGLSNAEAIACVAKSLEEIAEPFNPEVSEDAEEKDQNGDTTIINSFPNLSEHASEASTKRKMMEIDSSGIHDSTTEAEKRMYTPDIQKEATAMMMDTSANALSYIAGSSSGTVGCNLSEETSGAVTVQNFRIESTKLKPSPNPAETTITETDVSMFQLSDITSVCMTDPVERKVKEVDITNSKEAEFPLLMKQEDWWLFDFEWALGESSSEVFNSTTKEPLLKERQKPQLLNQTHHIEGVGAESFTSNSLKSGIPEHRDRPFPMFELGLLPESSLGMEMEYKPSTMKSFKRILDENNSMNEKIKEETRIDFSGEKSCNVVSACQSPGTRQKSVLPPLIKKGEELGNLQVTRTMQEGRLKGLVKEEVDRISNFHAANEFGVKKPLKLLSCTTSVAAMNLEFLSIARLRAMAKERNLQRYSKLNKSDLIKLLNFPPPAL